MPLLLHPFRVDVTPPVGDYLCGGCHPTSLGVESPLSLRGSVLDDGRQRVALAAVEHTYLVGRSLRRVIEAIARAAGTTPDRVSVHCVHTHDAPLIHEEAHALCESALPGVHNESYFSKVIADTEQAVSQAMARDPIDVAGVSFRQHRVTEFASNRRIVGHDNRCKTRWSVCYDPPLLREPEGRIDPMLDQIVFHGSDGAPAACWSFYACHPQVSDRRRMISGDSVGVALDLFEKTNPNVLPIYFTGCAGDITAGKYTTPNRHRNRLVFGVRLFDAMQAALVQQPEVQQVDSIGWFDSYTDLPLRNEEYDAAHFRAIIDDPATDSAQKYLAAGKLDRLQRRLDVYPFRISRLRLAGIDVLLLPAEMLIEFQLYAKAKATRPLTVAAYGDCLPMYVPHAAAFAQGGYEVKPSSTYVDERAEPIVKAGIDRALAAAI